MKKERKSKRDPYPEHQTTIEKLKKDKDTFVVLKTDGKTREKKLYFYKGYCPHNKKYLGQDNQDTNSYRKFEKLQKVIANPDY